MLYGFGGCVSASAERCYINSLRGRRLRGNCLGYYSRQLVYQDILVTHLNLMIDGIFYRLKKVMKYREYKKIYGRRTRGKEGSNFLMLAAPSV